MSRIEFPKNLLAQMRLLKDEQVPDNYWIRYGDAVTSYEKSLQSVLEGQRLLSFIQGKANPVVIDLMAPQDTLVDLFLQLQSEEEIRAFTNGDTTKNLHGQGIAVSYEDKRDIKGISVAKRLGITQIIGDIRQKKTLRKVKEELCGKKADLILERAWGALNCLPHHPIFYVYVMRCIWEMLNENGTALLQTPTICVYNDALVIEKWSDFLVKEGFQILYKNYVLRLEKKPNSPLTLPFPPELIE